MLLLRFPCWYVTEELCGVGWLAHVIGGACSCRTNVPGGPEALSESPWCNDMVADLHFLRFFGTAIKCEIAQRFPRSVVKVGLHVQCKNISISSGVQPWPSTDLKSSYFNTYMWAVQILKRGIGKTWCKPMRNLAKIQMSPKRFRPPWNVPSRWLSQEKGWWPQLEEVLQPILISMNAPFRGSNETLDFYTCRETEFCNWDLELGFCRGEMISVIWKGQ